MGEVASGVEAGDLLDRLGQGVDQATARVGGLGKDTWAELAHVPGRAVAAAGAGAIGGAVPVQDDGQAGDEDAGPVLVRGVGAAGLSGDGSVH
jgi:hypothetical protein